MRCPSTTSGIASALLRWWVSSIFDRWKVEAWICNYSFSIKMYAIAWAVDLPTKIGHLEVFVLIVSCICHDLDHPGYNNIYQINARTELALRYNDISPLENHHCSVAFRVLESPECNILSSLDAATFRTVREGIIRCILATDMARHNEILSQFTDIVPEFDYQNKTHINLVGYRAKCLFSFNLVND